MGRHEALRPNLSHRVGQKVDAALEKTPFKRPKFPRLKKYAFQPFWGFVFSVGFALVTIVDPYAGTMASASTIQVFDIAEQPEDQSYGISTTQTISFARGGFNILTGDDAAALFVEQASIPLPGTAKAYAYELLKKMNFGEDQYSCLVKLWERESNWRVNARNKSSGAYGIPQSLPGSKMASEGPDWQTNHETQVRWGVKYIKGRYGSPCGALAHSDKIGWY
ncbi:lytic transglycosylase domain-containing protein [Rhodoluna sp.]|uniref:aggregation-promoting factor C-terminal-like domain-containing protein n=1 Tax=Rhodoluna sp. TaxID=1969481 RepID=UPI0025D31094|nr:lytic transglycosylase domain-containing protein [Rhodoluna sp.]